MWGGICATMNEVRRQPAGTRSLLPLCGLQESSSGCQAWCQAQGVRLGVRSLYQLSHPASPSTTILER